MDGGTTILDKYKALLSQAGVRQTDTRLYVGNAWLGANELQNPMWIYSEWASKNIHRDKQLAEAFYGLPPTDGAALLSQAITHAVNVTKEAAEAEETEANAPNEREASILNKMHLCVDINGGNYFLWSLEKRRISEWAVTAVKLMLRPNIWAKFSAHPLPAKIVFDPYRGMKNVWREADEGITVYKLNAYIPPIWQERDYTEAEMASREEKYPPLFDALLRHLIPLPAHREVVLDWMALAIFRRPIAYLSLRGGRGTGKTIFKHILFNLVGNGYDAGRRVISDFNADLKHKRIVAMDDNAEIGTRAGNIARKNLLNPTMSLNEKHVQTQSSEEMYLSAIILTNLSAEFYVEYDERRIVSPTMGTAKMETWATTEIFDWLRAFEGDRNISPSHIGWLREIGESLLARLHKRNPSLNLQLRSGPFWADVYYSLTSFKRYICSCAFQCTPDNNILDYEELKINYVMEEGGRGHREQWASIAKWVENDFRYYDLPLVTGINYQEKTMAINPKLCFGKREGVKK